MTKAEDANVGDKENCQSCGTEMTCGLTVGSDKFPPKKQWQVDGRAHYNYDFKTKVVSCNLNVIPPEQYISKKLDNMPPGKDVIVTTDDIKAVIIDNPTPDRLKAPINLVAEVFGEAHKLTRSLYPNLPETSHVFGQIRCKFTEHILEALKITKQ